jgi:molybdenum cofactor cytidylyltransferase
VAGPGVRALVLCGGRATRFGSDKLLMPIERGGARRAMAAWCARNAIDGSGNALAVIPPGAAPLREALEAEGCEILETADTARGLGASLAAGVRHANEADGWIVALGDMPFIAPATFTVIANALRGGALIAAPVHEGHRGHPVAFSRALFDELVALDGDEGARAVIARHSDEVLLSSVVDAGITRDIDTPADLTP